LRLGGARHLARVSIPDALIPFRKSFRGSIREATVTWTRSTGPATLATRGVSDHAAWIGRARTAHGGARARCSMAEVGSVPLRAAVGDRARGLQRLGQRLGLLQPRPGALAGLPLGRGRAGRRLRRPAAALLRALPVERKGPHPEGAPLRPDEQRGESR